jgi:hypothetical protein
MAEVGRISFRVVIEGSYGVDPSDYGEGLTLEQMAEIDSNHYKAGYMGIEDLLRSDAKVTVTFKPDEAQS